MSNVHEARPGNEERFLQVTVIPDSDEAYPFNFAGNMTVHAAIQKALAHFTELFPRNWQEWEFRLAGRRLDENQTLEAAGVTDGTRLVLTTHEQSPGGNG